MSTEQQRAEWREFASRLANYGLECRAQNAMRALLADVDALTGEVARLMEAGRDMQEQRAGWQQKAKTIEAAYIKLSGEWWSLASERDALAAELATVRAQLARLTAPKFIDKVTELGNHVASLVPVRKFDIVPYHNNKRYSLTWTVELASGNTRDFNVIVTDDGKNEQFSADENVDETVRKIQRKITQWEYEELLQRP